MATKIAFRPRNPESTKADILTAAREEFAQAGLAGARIEKIAERSGSNKRMIYHYFGDKDQLFAAALEAAYLDIRTQEQNLGLEKMAPVDAMRRLIEFTWEYYLAHPEFIALVNSENLQKAEHIKDNELIKYNQKRYKNTVSEILKRGQASGVFRADIDAVQLVITIAAIGFYYLNNRHTGSVLFGFDFMSQAALKKRLIFNTETIMRTILSQAALKQHLAFDTETTMHTILTTDKAMSDQYVNIENHGLVRVLTMTGVPRRGNPMSPELAQALLAALKEAMVDESVKSIVLAGTETYFCVGADLVNISKLEGVTAILSGWLDDLDVIRRMPKPIVAAVRGHAVGGGFELALYCDLIIAAEDASFALPETGIGVIAGQGGTQRLIGLAGRAIAADLILTGRTLTGVEAKDFGIAARSVPADQVLQTAIAVADVIARRSAPAIAFAREILLEASEGPLRQSLRIERLLAAMVLDTADAKERIGDFLNRRNTPKAI